MLFWPWNRREVLLTQSPDQFYTAQRALQDAGIRYRTRIVGSSGSRWSFLGRVGAKSFYYIFVGKEDEGTAYHHIRKAT
jgi:hypothetical protein